MLYLSKNPDIAFQWVKIAYFFGVPFISPSVYLFSVSWTGRQSTTKIPIVAYLIALLCALLMFGFSKHIFGITTNSWGYFNFYHRTLFGIGYFILLFGNFVVFASLSFRNVYLSFLQSTVPSEKTHLRQFLFAFMIGYTGSVDFSIAWGLDLYPFGHLSFICFISIIAYSIFRHRFLGIKIVIKKISVFVLIYAILIILSLPFIIPFLQRYLNPNNLAPIPTILTLSIFLGLLFSSGPLIYAFLIRKNFWLRAHVTTGLTHEFKSPLGAIQSASDIVLEEIQQEKFDREKLIDYLHMIQANTTRLETYVKDLLSLARSQDDDVEVEKSHCNLKKIIEEVLTGFRPSLDKKGLALLTTLEEIPNLEIDANKIKQVVSNILLNAIKFSDQGTIRCELAKKGPDVCVSIHDQGCGIPKSSLEKIFDRFYQAHPGQKGSGIGLTIAKAWVDAHGGKIWAESEGEGKGTTVRFTLPFK